MLVSNILDSEYQIVPQRSNKPLLLGMFDKHAKSDEQLLLYVSQFLSPINVSEQAKFISSRRAANSSKTMMVSSDSCRKSVPLSDYVSSVGKYNIFLSKSNQEKETKTPCFLPTIVVCLFLVF